MDNMYSTTKTFDNLDDRDLLDLMVTLIERTNDLYAVLLAIKGNTTISRPLLSYQGISSKNVMEYISTIDSVVRAIRLELNNAINNTTI